MSIRIIASTNATSDLPNSALLSKGLGRWAQQQVFHSPNVKLEVRPHVLFKGQVSLVTLDSGVSVATSGFVYPGSDGLAEGDALRTLADGYERGASCLHSTLCELDGEFAGVLVDPTEQRLVLFSNKCGTVPIYYSTSGQAVVASCQLLEHAGLLRCIGAKVAIDEQGAMAYLGQGGMVDETTILSGVKRVLPGEVVSIDWGSGTITRHRYFLLSNAPRGPSGAEAVEALDSAFAAAVGRQYEFDRGLGRKHIGSLSGGLDSRMDAIVAYECGYVDRMNFSFGEPGCLDLRIAEQISAAQNQSQIVIELSGGSFLVSSLRDASIMNGGVSVAAGACHSVFAASCVDWSNFGLLHTGQLGDAVFNSFLKGPFHERPQLSSGAYSSMFESELTEQKKRVAEVYENHELYMLYTRGFMTTNGGLASFLPICPTTSPFLDTEFLSLVLSIPPEQRWKHRLYFRWIRDARPSAGEFVWDATGRKPGTTRRTVKSWLLRAKDFARSRLVATRAGRRTRHITFGMNPFDKWERQNVNLASFVTHEIARLDDLGVEALGNEKWAQVAAALEHGSCLERLQVLSFLFTVEALLAPTGSTA